MRTIKNPLSPKLLITLQKKFGMNLNILRINIEILATKTKELGKKKLMPYSIQLIKGAVPIKQKTYRLSKVQADALKEELIKLLENNLIEPSYSPWSFPVILVPKKNKKWRMCIDFRKINKNSKTKRNMTEIQMLNKDQKFSITDEAQNLYPKINLSQLLAESPTIRKELE